MRGGEKLKVFAEDTLMGKNLQVDVDVVACFNSAADQQHYNDKIILAQLEMVL